MMRTEQPLSEEEIEAFITNGFVKVVDGFPRELADAARAILWQDLGCHPDDPGTWTRPVVRLGLYSDEPFVRAANTPRLHRAFDQLVGAGRWLPRTSLGTFPVRFPSSADSGDTGWHIDVSFGSDALDFLLATGQAGTVYLCHPFLVHAAQLNRGGQPRFVAQPPLQPAEPLRLQRADAAYSPVEQAIRRALARSGAGAQTDCPCAHGQP
jgi:hypothetical protein